MINDSNLRYEWHGTFRIARNLDLVHKSIHQCVNNGPFFRSNQRLLVYHLDLSYRIASAHLGKK